jgi:hypothetical protein
MTLYANGVSVGRTKYFFVQSGVALNLNTATPMGTMPPLVPSPNPHTALLGTKAAYRVEGDFPLSAVLAGVLWGYS